MILDLAVLAALAAAAALGALAGLLRQLAGLAAAALALVGARHLADPAAALLARWVPPFAAGPLGAAAAFAALYLALSLAFGLVARAVRAAGGVPAALDRGAGALLGGAKAGLVLWVLLSALVAWGRPVPGAGALHAEASGFAAFARERNALGVAPRKDPRALTPRERREAAAAQWRGTGEPAEDGR